MVNAFSEKKSVLPNASIYWYPRYEPKSTFLTVLLLLLLSLSSPPDNQLQYSRKTIDPGRVGLELSFPKFHAACMVFL